MSKALKGTVLVADASGFSKKEDRTLIFVGFKSQSATAAYYDLCALHKRFQVVFGLQHENGIARRGGLQNNKALELLFNLFARSHSGNWQDLFKYLEPQFCPMTNSHGHDKGELPQADDTNAKETATMDPTRRKRLQNRLAQQRYRKRLRNHIEDLEQRAARKSVPLESQSHTIRPDNTCNEAPHAKVSAATPRFEGKSPLPFVLSNPVQIEDEFSDFVDQPALWDQSWVTLTSTTQRHGDESHIHTSNGLRTPTTGSSIDKDFCASAETQEMTVANDTAAQDSNKPRLPLCAERSDSPHNLSNPLLLLKYQNPQTLQPKSDPWDAQILQISKFVGSLGFQSFDELVGFYYSGEFEVGSMAHSKQKLSRGRNLPSVLRTLQDSTATWSVWESSGYRNEILHAAEDILVEEIDQAVAPMRISDSRTKESTEESRCAGHGNIKLSLIEELPNLWAFLTAVLSGESRAIRHAKQKTLLALVAMLSTE